MKKIFLVMAIFFSLDSWSEQNSKLAIENAMRVLDSFMTHFNARDMEQWSETLNYPHVRFAGSEVTVWDTKEEYSSVDIFDRLTSTGWHHSAWLSRKVILVSEDKVHISTVFQRYDENNNPLKQYQSLYIVTNKDGHWGVQARSSLAP
jgi:Fe-S cluster biosynthesis and repair protein YggX|tara:strand:+ start:2353 stop:2796 length:444 start_codon:yes stop_codon:yes gene_type:complete